MIEKHYVFFSMSNHDIEILCKLFLHNIGFLAIVFLCILVSLKIFVKNLKSWRSENHTPHYYWLNQSK